MMNEQQPLATLFYNSVKRHSLDEDMSAFIQLFPRECSGIYRFVDVLDYFSVPYTNTVDDMIAKIEGQQKLIDYKRHSNRYTASDLVEHQESIHQTIEDFLKQCANQINGYYSNDNQTNIK